MAEGRYESWDHNVATMTMLASYGTMPMLVNLYVQSPSPHCLFSDLFASNTSPNSMIHIYIALVAWIQILRAQWAHVCCCCQSNSGCLRLERNGAYAARKDDGVNGRQILKFYDEALRPSSEFMTSGCNTPRMSQETLGSEVRCSGELV